MYHAVFFVYVSGVVLVLGGEPYGDTSLAEAQRS